MPLDPGVFDANILAYAFNGVLLNMVQRELKWRRPVIPFRRFMLTSQILCEFYSVITNPRRVAVASSPVQALAVVGTLLKLPGLHLLPAPIRAVQEWMDLLRRHPVRGSDIFDLQIVATMKANGVGTIYTFNRGDFEVFPEILVVSP
jgi:predicted nucleic acid-binding protein